MKYFLLFFFILLLSGCGGGGGSTNTTSNSLAVIVSTSSSLTLSSSSSFSISSSSRNSNSSISSSSPSSQSNSNGFVFIPDETLKDAIRNELNLTSNAEVTSAQMQSMNSLQIMGAPSSLTGLETATNLTFLDITNSSSDQPDLDLNPLSQMSKLQSLYLIGFTLGDLSPIENLTDIDDLDFSNSLFNNLAPIAGFNKLTTLWLNNTQLTELPAFIANLSKLEWISISENPIDNNGIAPLATLPIRRLSIDYTEINDLAFLANKHLLRSLNITGTPVYNLTPLLTSGLASGSSLIASYSCIHLGKYSANIAIIAQLKNRGVSVFNAYQSPGTYGDPEKICENSLSDLNAMVNTVYNNGNMEMTWNFDGTTDTLTCEIYSDLQGQQPRTSIAVIDNCDTTLASTIATSSSNAPISLLAWNQFGSKKLFSSSITTETQTDTYLHSHDWGQTIVKRDAKLIPNKSALLRLHFIGSVATPVPDIQVQAIVNAIPTNLAVIKPLQIPQIKNFNASNQSYRVEIDKALMQSGLSIKVIYAGIEKIITPDFGVANELNITLIPIKITNTTGVIPDHTAIQNAFLELWPLSEVNLSNRAIYTSTATTAEDMENVLYEIEELHTLDGDNSHYYGFFSDDVYDQLNFSGFGGIAFIGSTTGIGADRDSNFSIMLHELGHNFNLQHINCGGPTHYDLLYPYSTNSIGSMGINANFTNLYLPNLSRDIMSYCNPEFISDYSYEKAQDYLEENPSLPFKVVNSQKISASIERSWFISGTLSRSNSGSESYPIELRRILPVNKKSTFNTKGQYQIIITDTNNEVHTQFFDIKELDHQEASSKKFFSLLMPHHEIAKLDIYEGNKLVFSQTESMPTNNLSRSQLQKTRLQLQPKVTQGKQQVCLNWNTQAYDSATLILLHNDGQSTVFMDTKTQDYCVDFESVTQGNQWQILLRKGLSVAEVRQDY